LVRHLKDTAHLVWNSRCVHNLATYLLREPCLGIIRKGGRVGIVVKGCDARAVGVLIQEGQLARQNLHLLGMVCDGMEATQTGGQGARPTCRSCQWQVPGLYDDLIGEPSRVKSVGGDPDEDIDRIRSMSQEERWDFWTSTLSGCIKCYACRQACPLCYCPECITEVSRPQWIDKASSLRGNLAYHLIRAMHLAGRCVSCGECARACPLGIPADLLPRFLARRVEETFGYRAGEDPEAEAFLATFKDDDPDDFVR
jgi:formate dehydrogenase subunit beta